MTPQRRLIRAAFHSSDHVSEIVRDATAELISSVLFVLVDLAKGTEDESMREIRGSLWLTTTTTVSQCETAAIPRTIFHSSNNNSSNMLAEPCQTDPPLTVGLDGQ